MSQPQRTRWEDLDPARRAELERELRARGIDPSTVKAVHIEPQPASPDHAADNASLDEGLIDLTSPTPTPTPTPLPASEARSPRAPATIQGPVEIVINGERHTYASLDQAPLHVRALLAGIEGATGATGATGSTGSTGSSRGTREGSITTTTTTTTLDPEHTAQLESLIRQGRTIDAIKLVRECTGMGLAEAKDLVDRLIPILAPGKAQRRGCLGMLLLATGVGAMAGATIAAGLRSAGVV